MRICKGHMLRACNGSKLYKCSASALARASNVGLFMRSLKGADGQSGEERAAVSTGSQRCTCVSLAAASSGPA
eukprot:2661478-Pleurochrysis_carterae.AAC.2